MVPRNHSAGLVFFMPRIQFCSYRGGGAVQKVGGGGRGEAEAGGRDEWGEGRCV